MSVIMYCTVQVLLGPGDRHWFEQLAEGSKEAFAKPSPSQQASGFGALCCKPVEDHAPTLISQPALCQCDDAFRALSLRMKSSRTHMQERALIQSTLNSNLCQASRGAASSHPQDAAAPVPESSL